MAFGRAEIEYPWGGDIVVNPNGDWNILLDAPDAPLATTQRVVQLILTNARDTVYDYAGNLITLRPDDLCNPTYGSSIRRLIGSNASNALLGEITSRLLAAFATDPGIATSPAPSVSVSYAGGHIVLTQIALYDVGGNLILIPDQAISPFGTAV